MRFSSFSKRSKFAAKGSRKHPSTRQNARHGGTVRCRRRSNGSCTRTTDQPTPLRESTAVSIVNCSSPRRDIYNFSSVPSCFRPMRILNAQLPLGGCLLALHRSDGSSSAVNRRFPSCGGNKQKHSLARSTSLGTVVSTRRSRIIFQSSRVFLQVFSFG